jgi:hypothetical protein
MIVSLAFLLAMAHNVFSGEQVRAIALCFSIKAQVLIALEPLTSGISINF